jgi:hypothetical protein
VVLFSAYGRNEIALSMYRDSRADALYHAGKAKRGTEREREGKRGTELTSQSSTVMTCSAQVA